MHIYANMHMLTTSIAKKNKSPFIPLSLSNFWCYICFRVLFGDKKNTQYTYKNEK